jgi:hypothetical protein
MNFRNKTVAALLSFLGGGLGAPWLYLGSKGWWLAPAVTAFSLPLLLGVKNWYQTPAFFLAMVPVIAGFVYALVIALMRDEAFDARYNPGQTCHNRSGWGAVLVAAATLLVGAIVTMTTIVLLIQTLVERSLGR